MYSPNRWVVLKIKDVYKVLAGWSGGYLDADEWRMNSGISKVEEDGDYYLFHGYSGSTYKCHKKGYGLTGLTASILDRTKTDADKIGLLIEVIPEDTNWMEIDYES
jgi:hypothetical protein